MYIIAHFPARVQDFNRLRCDFPPLHRATPGRPGLRFYGPVTVFPNEANTLVDTGKGVIVGRIFTLYVQART